MVKSHDEEHFATVAKELQARFPGLNGKFWPLVRIYDDGVEVKFSAWSEMGYVPIFLWLVEADPLPTPEHVLALLVERIRRKVPEAEASHAAALRNLEAYLGRWSVLEETEENIRESVEALKGEENWTWEWLSFLKAFL